MCTIDRGDNQDASSGNHQNKVDVKKRKVEIVSKNLLSSSSEDNTDCRFHSFVKTCKNTVINGDEDLQTFNDVAVKGLCLFHLFLLYLLLSVLFY